VQTAGCLQCIGLMQTGIYTGAFLWWRAPKACKSWPMRGSKYVQSSFKVSLDIRDTLVCSASLFDMHVCNVLAARYSCYITKRLLCYVARWCSAHRQHSLLFSVSKHKEQCCLRHGQILHSLKTGHRQWHLLPSICLPDALKSLSKPFCCLRSMTNAWTHVHCL